jgi:hypothetical protein
MNKIRPRITTNHKSITESHNSSRKLSGEILDQEILSGLIKTMIRSQQISSPSIALSMEDKFLSKLSP